MKQLLISIIRVAALTLAAAMTTMAAPGDKAPERTQGQGPYDRLILRGGILINGEGAPARGPVDVVIEQDRIVAIHNVGYPGTPILVDDRPKAKAGDKEIDVTGGYAWAYR